MNERIEELIGQCIDQRWTVTGPMFDREKFAELIVRECADIAGKAEYSDTWTEPVEDTIKKHFGVKE